MQMQSEAWLQRGQIGSSIHWRLITGLVVLHVLLLPAVHFSAEWFGDGNASYRRWSQSAVGSLNVAQYDLLIGFCAISRWDWGRRIVLLMTGLVVLTLLHVAVMFPLTKAHESAGNVLLASLLNMVDVFVCEALVLAVILESFRPLLGGLTRGAFEEREQITILALLRLTTMAAFAAGILRFSGTILDDSGWFSIHCLLRAGLVSSCIWMMFPPRYVWLGTAGCLASVVVGVLNTPAEIRATYGFWHWLPPLCLQTVWICSTFMVVRAFGFRLRKHSMHRTVPTPDPLLTANF